MRDRLKLLNLPLLIASLSWGFNFVSVKIVYREVSPSALALMRFLVMWALLVLYCVIRGESLRPRPGDGWKIVGLGCITMGIYMMLFMTGMHATTASEGAIVLATVPLLTPLIALLVRQEVFSAPALFGAIVAFSGVACVALGGAAGSHGSLTGNLLILTSAFVWASGIVLSRPLLARYSASQLLTMSMVGAFPLLLPFGIVDTLHTPWLHLKGETYLMFAQVAVLSGVVSFICFNLGVQQIGASGASLYQFFVPALAALFSFLLLHQTLSPIQWIGFAVVLAGVAYGSIARQRANALSQVEGQIPAPSE